MPGAGGFPIFMHPAGSRTPPAAGPEEGIAVTSPALLPALLVSLALALPAMLLLAVVYATLRVASRPSPSAVPVLALPVARVARASA